MDNKQIEEMLRLQQEMLVETQKDVHRIYKFLVWGWIGGILKFLVFIVLPLTLSFLYLPPLISQLTDYVTGMLNQVQGASLDVGSLLKQLR